MAGHCITFFRNQGDEIFGQVKRFIVGELTGWMFAKIRRRAFENTALAAVQCEFDTPDRIDGDSGRIGRIFDR